MLDLVGDIEQKAILRQGWNYQHLNDAQVLLLKSIYTRKIANPSKKMYLTKDEIDMICTINEEGLEESIISFGELGIFNTSL